MLIWIRGGRCDKRERGRKGIGYEEGFWDEEGREVFRQEMGKGKIEEVIEERLGEESAESLRGDGEEKKKSGTVEKRVDGGVRNVW